MKKLIPLLLVIISVSLHSQETKYWEKIDFQFDSGIKQIDICDYCNNGEFIVLTQNDNLYHFDYKYSLPKMINLDNNIGEIIKVKIVEPYPLQIIYLLNSIGQLYYTIDYGNNWFLVNDEIRSNSILDFDVNINAEIVVATIEDSIFLNNHWGTGWESKNNEKFIFDVEKIFSFCSTFYILSKDNHIFELNDEIALIDSIKEDEIIDISFDAHNKFVWLNSNNKLFYYDYNKEKFFETNDTLNITCFVATDFNLVSMNYLNEIQPYQINLGTDKKGIFGINFYGSFEQVGSELIGKKISDIEITNCDNPMYYLVGTHDGEVFYSQVKLDVKEFSNNILQSQISPQPATTKSRLSFTLPMESRVSVKLFNTLGIEQFAIENNFFSAGENSFPLDVSGLSDGMYFVAIQYDGKTVVEKLVVSR